MGALQVRIFWITLLFIFGLVTSTSVGAQQANPPNQPNEALRIITHSPWAVQAKLKAGGNPLANTNLSTRPTSQPPPTAPRSNSTGVYQPPIMTADDIMTAGRTVPLVGGTINVVGTYEPDPIDKKTAEMAKKRLESLGGPRGGVVSTISLPLNTALVLWESAAPVRTARAQIGLAETTHNRANTYVISVIGYPLRAALGKPTDLSKPVSEDIKRILLQGTELKAGTRAAVAPYDVECGGSDFEATLRFFFTANPAVQIADREVRLRSQVIFGDIAEATFRLSDMKHEGRLELLDETAHSVAPAPSPASLTAGPKLQTEAQGQAWLLYDQALKSANIGALETAVQQFREVIQALPDEAAPHYNLAVALQRRLDPQAALTQYREVVRLTPNDDRAHKGIGDILDNAGDPKGAIEEYRQAIRLNPIHASHHFDLGAALFHDQSFDKALPELERCLQLDHTQVNSHFLIARILESRGDLKGAIERYRAELKVNPKKAEAHYYLGRLIGDTENAEQALPELKLAAELDPDKYQKKYEEAKRQAVK